MCLQNCNHSLMWNERDGLRTKKEKRFSRNFLCGNSLASALEQEPYLQGARREAHEGWNFKRSIISSPEGVTVLEIVDTERRFHEVSCSTCEFPWLLQAWGSNKSQEERRHEEEIRSKKFWAKQAFLLQEISEDFLWMTLHTSLSQWTPHTVQEKSLNTNEELTGLF